MALIKASTLLFLFIITLIPKIINIILSKGHAQPCFDPFLLAVIESFLGFSECSWHASEMIIDIPDPVEANPDIG